MGYVIPRQRTDMIAFLDQHRPGWNANKIALGIEDAVLSDLTARIAAANAAYTAAVNAHLVAKSSTRACKVALQDLRRVGESIVNQIKATASASADPSAVYVLGQIPKRGASTPSGVPDPPTDVTAQLNNDGDALVEWAGSRRYGTFFSVYRQLDGAGAWTLLGSVARKEFIDRSLPAGTTCAAYRVTAQRSAGESIGSEPVLVLFGSSGLRAA